MGAKARERRGEEGRRRNGMNEMGWRKGWRAALFIGGGEGWGACHRAAAATNPSRPPNPKVWGA